MILYHNMISISKCVENSTCCLINIMQHYKKPNVIRPEKTDLIYTKYTYVFILYGIYVSLFLYMCNKNISCSGFW